MPTPPVTHATFTIERTYDADPARVFRAFSDRGAKMRWFVGVVGWTTESYDLDFRTGGHERARGLAPNGMKYANDTFYHEIVPNERIVFAYAMDVDDKRISTSLGTITFEAGERGTRLRYTEQGAFLESVGPAGPDGREDGCRGWFDRLALELSRPT